MSGFAYTREWAWARAGAGGPAELGATAFELAATAGGEWRVRTREPRRGAEWLADAAASALDRLAPALPPARRAALVVEAGDVDVALRRDRRRPQRSYRTYLIALCAGAVVALERSLSGAPATPWSGSAERGGVAPAAAVVLGPSALLGLLAVALDHEPGGGNGRGGPQPELVATPRSPYPPHDEPLMAGGHAREWPLIAGGAPCPGWRSRSAPQPATLVHDACSRPPGVVSELPLAGLRAQLGGGSAAVPGPALVIESLRPLSAALGGEVEWEAGWALRDGDLRAGDPPLRFAARPWSLLARVTGQAGPARPALHADPVDGERFGVAPAAATGMVAGELGVAA